MGRHEWYEAIWDLSYVSKGKVLWREVKKNALVDEGEKLILNSFFRNTDNPSYFYIRLCNDTLDEQSTLLSVENEPSGNGYSPYQLPRSTTGFPTLEYHEYDWRVRTAEFTFTASGGPIGPVKTCFIATSSDSSGYLVGVLPLSMTRTILDGDSLVGTIWIKMK